VDLSTKMWVDVIDARENLRRNRTLAGLSYKGITVWRLLVTYKDTPAGCVITCEYILGAPEKVSGARAGHRLRRSLALLHATLASAPRPRLCTGRERALAMLRTPVPHPLPSLGTTLSLPVQGWDPLNPNDGYEAAKGRDVNSKTVAAFLAPYLQNDMFKASDKARGWGSVVAGGTWRAGSGRGPALQGNLSHRPPQHPP
jgi:hypothetical protein